MKNILLLLTVFITLSLQAQWTDNTDVNTLVSTTESGDMHTITTSNGQTYIVYWKAVAEPTSYELWLQLLDASGNRQFGDEGMLISNNIGMSSYTVMWSVTIDADDNLYIGVTGTEDFTGRAFKMDMEGNQLWGANGISISNAFLVTILPMENGETLISWSPGTQAQMQKYDVDGNPVWAAPKTIENGSDKTAPGNIYEMSNGDFIMIFHAYNYGVSSILYAQRYNTDGDAQWASPTQLADRATAFNAYYSGVQDGDVVYYGFMASTATRFDSYLQRVNPDGTLPWGINGMDFDVNETDLEMGTKIAFTPGSPYVWSICTYSNVNQNQFGEYVQKFDKETGARQFTDNAKKIYPIGSEKTHAGDLRLVDDQAFFLLKTGEPDVSSPTRLDVVLLDENGDFAWEEETKPMATYSANKKRIHFNNVVNGQAVAVFIEDKTDGLKIYAQNFMNEMTFPAQPVLVSPENNAIEIPLAASFVWEDAAGAETYQIQIAEDDAFTSIITDQSDLSSTNFEYTLADNETIYFWRVRANNSNGAGEWSEIWSFTTEIISAVQDVNAVYALETYPNPAKDMLNIAFNSPISHQVHIAIYNAMGSVVYSSKESVAAGANKIEIDLYDFAPGNYYYQLIGDEMNISARFMIVK